MFKMLNNIRGLTFVLQFHTLLSLYSKTHSWIFQSSFNRSWHTVQSTQANAQLDITKQIFSRDETSRRVSSLRVDIRTDVDLSRVIWPVAAGRKPIWAHCSTAIGLRVKRFAPDSHLLRQYRATELVHWVRAMSRLLMTSVCISLDVRNKCRC